MFEENYQRIRLSLQIFNFVLYDLFEKKFNYSNE